VSSQNLKKSRIVGQARKKLAFSQKIRSIRKKIGQFCFLWPPRFARKEFLNTESAWAMRISHNDVNYKFLGNYYQGRSQDFHGRGFQILMSFIRTKAIKQVLKIHI
jgi:hypothetical protein